jgi:hypothetical protein
VRRRLRVAAIAAVCGLLAACNIVVSERPLFFPEDEAGASRLREGLWLGVDAKCRINTQRPVERWPECANAFVVRGGEFLQLTRNKRSYEWESIPFVLAGGEPRILQVYGVSPEAGPDAKMAWGFAGLAPTGHDAEGRIVAYRMWFAQCGPIRKPVDPSEARHMTTREPLPGVVMHDDGYNCTPADIAAVRGAVVASEAWSEGSTVARWIRDGDR